MKELLYLIKRMKKKDIASVLGIASSNISLWLITKRIPKKHFEKLNGLHKREIKHEAKTKKRR